MSAESVAQDQIKAFVERIMRLREEAKAIAGDIREVYAEAKGNGFDKTVLGKLVLYVEKRATDGAAMQEQDALFDLYLSAFDGAASHTHVHAREAVPDHDAETGEVLETKSTAARKDVGDNSTGNGPRKPSPEPEAATTPPAGTQVPPVDTNVTAFRTHDPATHFINSKGLARLHGCQGPEACASSQPRVKLCFACSTRHDGPVASEASA